MDVKDQTTHSGHGVHLCNRCGWPFPNPHPSAKLRRAHKKICGTIDGYTSLTSSEVVSFSDDDKDKTPSPKKKDIGGGMRGSFSRSEDELFSDAVAEFSDSGNSSGSAIKNLDRDVFFSFKDVENDEINKANTSVEVSEKIDPHVENFGEAEISQITTVCDSSESNLELTETGLVKDGVIGHIPEPSHISCSQASQITETITKESQITETIRKEAEDSELTKTTPEGSEVVGVDYDHLEGVVEEVKHENFEPDHKHVPEVAKESALVQDVSVLIEIEDLETHKWEKHSIEQTQELVKEPNTVLTEKEDLGGPHLEKQLNEHTHEAVEKPVSVLTEKQDLGAPELERSSKEQIQEHVNEPITVLTEIEDLGGPHLEKQLNEHTHEAVEKSVSVLSEKQDLGAPELESSSKEQIQEVVKQPDYVLTEKEDLGGPHFEKQLNEHTHEAVEKPVSVLMKKQDLGAPELEKSSNEQIQEVVKQADTVLTEKEDLGGAHLEEQPNKHNHEVIEKPDSVLTKKQDLGAPIHVEDRNIILTEKEDFGAPKSEKCSKDEVIEQKVDSDSNVIADVSVETVTQQFSSDNSVVNGDNASEVVHVASVEEGKMNNQDSGAALSVGSSTRSSVEGNWGSVSVLSTASIDVGTLQSTEKSKVNSGKSNAPTSDVFEQPSSMILAEAESKEKTPKSSELQDSQQQPNSEVKVNKESEGRKRNEESIAKVTNWSTGKQSTRLKNLLGEAKSPSGAQEDQALVKAAVNDDVASPPKLINDDDKKGRKKVKGLSSWVPFVCCSSVNVVN